MKKTLFYMAVMGMHAGAVSVMAVMKLPALFSDNALLQANKPVVLGSGQAF